MAIPDYFARNAVAIAQAISGLDEDRLSGALDKVRVGVTLGRDSEHIEGRALTDLLVRLLARLYPTLIFRAESKSAAAESARDLARRINPHVTLEGKPTIELVIGFTRLRSWASKRLYAGSTGWTATFSDNKPQSCGNTNIPFGAGVAACLAAANLFRHVFLPESALDADVTFDTLDHNRPAGSSIATAKMSTNLVLAGCGAIGNAAVWALSRVPTSGTITLVDHQNIDLGNLQRYVLTDRVDEGSAKPAVAARFFIGALKAIPVEQDLASYLETNGHRIDHLLLALDSAQDRRAAQASLPRWITNAWTQPGDLGISTHDFLNGACVSCLYLPERALMNEDAIIADAFGVSSRIMEIRVLLHRNDGVPRSLLEAIAAAKDIPLDRLLPFEGKPLRKLYVDGFCGGAALPLSRIGKPRAEVHVPLAHQSALAGVLLAAAAIRGKLGVLGNSNVTQLDVLKPLPPIRTRTVAKDPRGICICQDADYRDAYLSKYQQTRPKSRVTPNTSRRGTIRLRTRAAKSRSRA